MSFWSSVKSLGSLAFGSNKYDGKNNWNESMGRFNDLTAVDIDGKEMNLNVFDGKVLLITNVACKCGYTVGSYDWMQKLAIKYQEKGLEILCFPCNQFMSQEPWTEKEIKEWVIGKWPKLNPILFSKIEVNGDNTHKTYKYLKTVFPGDINWNFATKFVVGKNGIPLQRFDKNQSWDDIEKCIQSELDKQCESKKSIKTENVDDDEKVNDNDDDNKNDKNDNDDNNDKDKESKADKEENEENEKDKEDKTGKDKEEKQDKDNENNSDNLIKEEMDEINKKLSELKIKDEVNENDVKEIQDSLKSLQSDDDNIKQQINDLQSQLNQYQTKLNEKSVENQNNDNNDNNDQQ